MAETARHKRRQSLTLCPQCLTWVAAIKPPTTGCALGQERTGIHGDMCSTTRINLLEMALRRELAPDAFDSFGRILPGKLFEVMDLERAAMRRCAALSGPVPLENLPPQKDGPVIPKQMRYQTALYPAIAHRVDFAHAFGMDADQRSPATRNGIAPKCANGNRKFPRKFPCRSRIREAA